ncbi:helix-turn-helix domain-containing protein [Liquorilactobacillus hordei]|uniref:helix-turn-helix domain-containing protein n=1 Tax=Liquorilactobacillus hordei TaxID=468911 RepID=UPI0039E812C1
MAEQPSYYAIIPANVRYDKRLPSKAPLLYGEITALCNKEGFCWASDDYFMNLYSVSKSTIQLWLNSLAKNGYIEREVVFKKGSKEIDKRYIRIPDKVYRKTGIPYTEKSEYPIPKNRTDNNTNNNTTSNNTNNSAAKPAQLALKDEFEQLWKNYPNKKGKNAAFNHYKAWRKKSVKNTNEYLEQKLADYLRYCALNKDWYHPMNGSTWFNGRFDDELDLGGVKSDPWSRHYE